MKKINEPFCIINADDFYDYDSFIKILSFPKSKVADDHFTLFGYQINKTLFDYGKVSRGICKVDSNGYLNRINERTKVFKKNAEIVYEKNDEIFKIDNGGYGSMNFRGLTHLFLKIRLHFLRLSLMIINMIKKLNFITHQLPKH